MSYAEIALLEPLSVCLHATAKAELRLGEPILITGAGPIGIMQLLCANASGCSPIVITDLSQDRLDFAKKLVKDVHPFLIDLERTPQQTAAEIVDLFTAAASGVGGSGSQGQVMPVVTMECTGQESSIATAACEYSLKHCRTLAGVDLIFYHRCYSAIRPRLCDWRWQIAHRSTFHASLHQRNLSQVPLSI